MTDTKICENCQWWQPNGGWLDVGYCRTDKWSYRKPSQSCKKFLLYNENAEPKRQFVKRRKKS